MEIEKVRVNLRRVATQECDEQPFHRRDGHEEVNLMNPWNKLEHDDGEDSHL